MTSGVVMVPEGQPLPLDRAMQVLELSEAPAHGPKSRLVFTSADRHDRR